MHTGTATVIQISLDAERAMRLQCAPALIPAPGQYVMAQARPTSHPPLAWALFPSDIQPAGFTAPGPIADSLTPGTTLTLRGPLGRGFNLPARARRVGLVGFDASPARLLPLIEPSLRQGAAIALACTSRPADLPPAIEVNTLAAAPEIAAWADCLMIDVPRQWVERLPALLGASPIAAQAQALVHTPIPCGGMGECGVCAVTMPRGWKLACKDGPVFALDALMIRQPPPSALHPALK